MSSKRTKAKAKAKNAKQPAPATAIRQDARASEQRSAGIETQQVLQALQDLLAAQEQQAGAGSSKAADTLSTMAELLTAAGEFASAETLYRQAMEARQKQLGRESLSAAHTAHDLALVTEKTGNWAEAENLYAYCLQTTIAHRGPGHPSVPRMIERLGNAFEQQGKNGAEAQRVAADCIRNAVSDSLAKFPCDVYEKLGKQALMARNYKQAEFIFGVLRDVVTALGPRSPQLPRALQFLALTCAAQDRHDEALRLQSRAVERLGQLFGPNHPEYAKSLGHLADLQFAARKFKLALENAEKSRMLLIVALGKEHPDTVVARQRHKTFTSKLATKTNLKRLGPVKERLESRTTEMERQRELRRLAKAIGAEPTPQPPPAQDAEIVDIFPEVTDKMETFLFEKFMKDGRRAAKAKNYPEAERMFQAALKKAERFEQNDPRAWDGMCELADLYSSSGKMYKALVLYQSVLDVCKRQQGADSPTLAPYMYRLAQTYHAQGDLLKERDTIESIIKLLTDANVPEYELAPYKEKRLAIKRELEAD